VPYAFCSRTHSDVRIIRHVRIFRAYVFYSADVRILCYVRIYDACHSATGVLFCRTYAIDVRIHARTSLREIQIRDYTVRIRSRDYTVADPGVGTTQNNLDLMKKIPLAHQALV